MCVCEKKEKINKVESGKWRIEWKKKTRASENEKRAIKEKKVFKFCMCRIKIAMPYCLRMFLDRMDIYNTKLTIFYYWQQQKRTYKTNQFQICLIEI